MLACVGWTLKKPGLQIFTQSLRSLKWPWDAGSCFIISGEGYLWMSGQPVKCICFHCSLWVTKCEFFSISSNHPHLMNQSSWPLDCLKGTVHPKNKSQVLFTHPRWEKMLQKHYTRIINPIKCTVSYLMHTFLRPLNSQVKGILVHMSFCCVRPFLLL